METFDGYLFSKLDAIGSRSEGPKYFLQHFNYKEAVVLKKVHPWEQDAELHRFLNQKVTIEGSSGSGGIVYQRISEYKPVKEEKERKLEIALRTGSDTLWINKMPGGNHPAECMELTLAVKWPDRSIWEGYCPTTQIYDFWIEHKDKTIWQWSDGKVFAPLLTPVSIPGSSEYHEFTEVWKVDPEDVVFEGVYTARALFIAAGREVAKEFAIRFAH